MTPTMADVSSWRLQHGFYYVASRGPGDGNGGIRAISDTLERDLPRTVFIHKGNSAQGPCVMITTNGRSTPAEGGRLKQDMVAQAGWLGKAVMWFLLHSDPKNCDQFADIQSCWKAEDDNAIEPFNKGVLQDKCERAIARYEEGWTALTKLNQQMANVIYGRWRVDPRPIVINDFDQCLVASYLSQKDPSLANWILHMHHVPLPDLSAKRFQGVLPPCYKKYFNGMIDGMLSGGTRFVGLHTARDRNNLGHQAEAFGGGKYHFDPGLLEIKDTSSGRSTKLGQTLAGVDFAYYSAQAETGFVRDDGTYLEGGGTKSLDMSVLTKHPWMKGMKYVALTDRMDDPLKNGRRKAEAADVLFSSPEGSALKGQVVLFIVGSPSRQGIPPYDEYLANCTSKINEVNSKHRRGSWQPIVWLAEVVPSSVIAQIYGHPDCQGVFVGSKADGLHLGTIDGAMANAWKLRIPDAPDPGVVWVSRNVGSYECLGQKGAIHIEPRDVHQMADALLAGLTMSSDEKRWRAAELLQTAKREYDILPMLHRILRHAGFEN
jgi:trehalose-6-phosphate synthase